MRAYLSRLGLIDAAAAIKIAKQVRDRDDVTVWRCPKSGIIFLEGNDTEVEDYYAKKDVESDPNRSITTTGAVTHDTLWQDDDTRRAEQFSDFLRGKVWLDFGAGGGGLVNILRNTVSRAYAYELNAMQCTRMRAKSIDVLDDWSALADESLDVLTLFHVFEHLSQPIELLGGLIEKLKPRGVAIVEVPHANDFLLKQLDCGPFMRFSLWSEHLVLHTRASLEAMMRLAGLQEIVISGYQRYPLSNHLYWLRHGLPGGHELWGGIETDEFRSAYGQMLNRIDQTDTIIAVCRKPS